MSFPATLDQGLISRAIGDVVGHPLTAIRSQVITSIHPALPGEHRIITFATVLKPLLQEFEQREH